MSRIADIWNNDNSDILHAIKNKLTKFAPTKLLRNCNLLRPADLHNLASNNECYQQISLFGNALGKNADSGSHSSEDGDTAYYNMEVAKDDPVKKTSKCAKGSNPATWYSGIGILIDKIASGFIDQSFYETQRCGEVYGATCTYKKDTWYRFDRDLHVNWEGLQLGVAFNMIKEILANFETHGYLGALCFDDSIFQRTYGVHQGRSNARMTELLSQCFDHNLGKCVPGFRLFTCFWSIGEVGIPVQEALLTTREEKNMLGPVNKDKTDKRTWEGKRRVLAGTKGTDVMLIMTKLAIDAGIPFDDVLADSWFSNPAQAIGIMKLGKNFIAMTKHGKVKYGVLPEDSEVEESKITQKDLQWFDIKELYGRYRKRRGTSKYLLSIKVWIKDHDGNVYPIKLVFARNRNNRKDWVAFICTNTDMAEEEILNRYTIRWDIERFFKIEKSYLKLQDCHSTSYDALTARVVIAALRFMILSMERFENSDDRSIEQIFAQAKREIVTAMYDRIHLIFLNALLDSVCEVLHPSEDEMTEIILRFFDKLPSNLRTKFNAEAVAS